MSLLLQVKAERHRDLVIVVGSSPTVSAGEWLTAGGHSVIDEQHCRQLKTFDLRTMPPNTREGIEKYQASGVLHRPCAQANVATNAKGRRRRRYRLLEIAAADLTFNRLTTRAPFRKTQRKERSSAIASDLLRLIVGLENNAFVDKQLRIFGFATLPSWALRFAGSAMID